MVVGGQVLGADAAGEDHVASSTWSSAPASSCGTTRTTACTRRCCGTSLVANFADGNTVVNLRNIGQQLGGLLATAGGAAPEVLEAAAERAAALFGMDSELPPYGP